MKAVVLVGGEGTRLRPLTETVPKPLLPIVNRPLLHRVLDHLAAYEVHEVVLSSPYLEESFRPFIAERHGDPAVTWITEASPLGTGGAIVNALPHVRDGSFLVLNGDILTDLDLSALVEFHHERGAAATITLTDVDDARPFGLVETTEGTRVQAFQEKPAEAVPGHVNAGTYVLEPGALDAWAAGEVISVERQIFPALIGRGLPVHGWPSDAYWMDVGTPQKYLQAHFDVLDGKVRGLRYPAPFLGEGTAVDLRAHLGRWVVLGDGAAVGPGAEVEDSVLHPNASVGSRARVTRSILGPGVLVGAGAAIDDCVLGEGARIAERVEAAGVKLEPGSRCGEPA